MIVGKHIQLRAIEYQDLSLLVAWRNDPNVYKYFYEHEPLSLIMQRAWFEKLLERSDEKLWLVEQIDSQEAVGTIGLKSIDWRSRKAELARVFITKDHRGKGWGSELVCLVLHYFFDHLNMNRLYCDTLRSNQRAVEFYERLGFKQEGVLCQHVFKEGAYRDLVYFAMLRADYVSLEIQTKIDKYLSRA